MIRAVDGQNDWLFGKGKNDYKKDLDEIKQNIKTRLKSWRYDCFYAINEGVDYNSFLDKNTQKELDRDIKRVLLQTANVLRINKFESEIDINRDYKIKTSITTIYGITEISI